MANAVADTRTRFNDAWRPPSVVAGTPAKPTSMASVEAIPSPSYVAPVAPLRIAGASRGVPAC
jgi:hypothetical protein